MIKHMEKAFITIQMVIKNMMVNMRKIKNMVKEFFTGKMAKNMMANG